MNHVPKDTDPYEQGKLLDADWVGLRMFFASLTTARNGGYVVGNDDSAMDKAHDSSDAHSMAVYDPTPMSSSDQQHASYSEHKPTSACTPNNNRYQSQYKIRSVLFLCAHMHISTSGLIQSRVSIH